MYLFHTGKSIFTGRNYKVYLDINTSWLLRFFNHISGVHTTFTEVRYMMNLKILGVRRVT